MKTLELTGYRDCEQALKLPALMQALYDDGAILMDRVLVTLHDDEHRLRRNAEMRVFRRHFFRHFEHEVIPSVFEQVMSEANRQEEDLVDLGYHFMVFLALKFAGIDPQENTRAEFNDMVSMLRMFGVAATLGQAKDKDQLAAATEEVRQTLQEFDRRFFTPSAQRRQQLIDRVAPKYWDLNQQVHAEEIKNWRASPQMFTSLTMIPDNIRSGA